VQKLMIELNVKRYIQHLRAILQFSKGLVLCESLKIWFYDPLYICFEANDINFLFLPGKEAV